MKDLKKKIEDFIKNKDNKDDRVRKNPKDKVEKTTKK